MTTRRRASRLRVAQPDAFATGIFLSGAGYAASGLRAPGLGNRPGTVAALAGLGPPSRRLRPTSGGTICPPPAPADASAFKYGLHNERNVDSAQAGSVGAPGIARNGWLPSQACTACHTCVDTRRLR